MPNTSNESNSPTVGPDPTVEQCRIIQATAKRFASGVSLLEPLDENDRCEVFAVALIKFWREMSGIER